MAERSASHDRLDLPRHLETSPRYRPLKVFANIEAAESWLETLDPEGVAFECDVVFEYDVVK